MSQQLKTKSQILWVVTATGAGFTPFPAKILHSSQEAHQWARDAHDAHPELRFSVAGCEVCEQVKLKLVG